jgi:hypothetical protein
MSTPQRRQWTLSPLVPGYLAVIGLGLLAAAVSLWLYASDEEFTSILTGLGGITMVGSAIALLTVGRRQ